MSQSDNVAPMQGLQRFSDGRVRISGKSCATGPEKPSTRAPYPGGVHRRWATAISSAPTGTRRLGDSGIRIRGLEGFLSEARPAPTKQSDLSRAFVRIRVRTS